MKKIRLIGTKNKVDFSMYLSHTIASQGKRVLVVDTTAREEYLYTLGEVKENEPIFELDGIEILTGARNWAEVIQLLKQENEVVENYDCLIVDVDSVLCAADDWPMFEQSIYVSDSNRFNITRDIDLLHEVLDQSNSIRIKRVHFEDDFSIPEGYIELMMNHRIEFDGELHEIAYDERLSTLFLTMQHDQIIPYNKLDKSYKATLVDLTAEWFGIHKEDVKKHTKTSLIGKLFSKEKKESII